MAQSETIKEITKNHKEEIKFMYLCKALDLFIYIWNFGNNSDFTVMRYINDEVVTQKVTLFGDTNKFITENDELIDLTREIEEFDMYTNLCRKIINTPQTIIVHPKQYVNEQQCKALINGFRVMKNCFETDFEMFKKAINLFKKEITYNGTI